MNWFKKALVKTPGRAVHRSLQREIVDDLIEKLPENYSYYQEKNGWSVADENGKKLVYNEPNLLFALKLALIRRKFIN